MSWQPCKEPDCVQRSDEIELLIKPHVKDLGDFSVRRALPSPMRRAVGPYVFFDHAGPAQFPAGQGVDVRPHPHIGIWLITYLFEGEIVHRDSLGCVQPIQPGAVNLMVAGRGIVHSERTSTEQRARGARLHGIQLWLALPVEQEQREPSFTHYPAEEIPVVAGSNTQTTVIIGEAYGVRSPVAEYWPTLYVEALFSGPALLELPQTYEERAVYVVEGNVSIGESAIAAGDMAVIRPGAPAAMESDGPARAMVIGGRAIPENRTVWWNFVSSSKERIEQAKRDWAEGRFAEVPGDSEFIPLP